MIEVANLRPGLHRREVQPHLRPRLQPLDHGLCRRREIRRQLLQSRIRNLIGELTAPGGAMNATPAAAPPHHRLFVVPTRRQPLRPRPHQQSRQLQLHQSLSLESGTPRNRATVARSRPRRRKPDRLKTRRFAQQRQHPLPKHRSRAQRRRVTSFRSQRFARRRSRNRSRPRGTIVRRLSRPNRVNARKSHGQRGASRRGRPTLRRRRSNGRPRPVIHRQRRVIRHRRRLRRPRLVIRRHLRATSRPLPAAPPHRVTLRRVPLPRRAILHPLRRRHQCSARNRARLHGLTPEAVQEAAISSPVPTTNREPALE